MPGLLGVTGSPGTGKKTVSAIVARKMGLRVVGLNDLAAKYGLRAEAGSEVDTRAMRNRVASDIEGPAILFGHLLPYVVEPKAIERVVVLRCEPAVLKGRLVSRGYSSEKLTENVEAELIGVVSADSYDVFGGAKTSEVDTTRSTPARAAGAVIEALRGTAKARPRIDWTTSYDSGAKLRSLLGRIG